MASEIADYLINGLALNVGISDLLLDNFSFSKDCLKSWLLCFGLNSALQTINSTTTLTLVSFGLAEESASLFFHALRYSRSASALRVSNAKFSNEGFRQLANCIRESKSIASICLEDLSYLGVLVLWLVGT